MKVISKTICKECKHPVDTHKAYEYWRCGASAIPNYVTGEGYTYPAYCDRKNATGNCPDYEPAERIAAQAQADGEGVRG